jgi:thiol-disulfide isomerase/thioredoxin
VRLLASCLLALSIGAATATAEPSTPLLVKVHADWCGTCTKLGPTWDSLQAEYGAGARFVVLDVTDRGASQSATEQAEQLGVGEFFSAHKSKTGTIAIFEPGSSEPVAVWKGELDAARYREVLEQLDAERAS